MKTTIRNYIGKMSRMAKLVMVAATLATVGAGPSESQAATGTLSGCVTTTEVRANPTTADTGLLWTSRPGNVRQVRRALIRLRISRLFGPEFFTVTNDVGCYSVAWRDDLSFFFPVQANVAVIWASPDMALNTQRTTAPGRLFTIHNGPLFSDLATSRTVNLNATTTQNVSVTGGEAGEHTAAYLTAEEFYARVVRQSTTLLNTMKGVAVHINSTPPGPSAGVTPTASDVFLTGGTARNNAFVQAHELGHIVVWRSLGLALAPFRADFLDYACDNVVIPSHSWDSLECEKAAWNEGFAHLAGAAWMWARTAPRPVIPEDEANGFDLESEGCDTPSVGNECTQAKALWDIYDSRTGDDDGIVDRSMVSITQVLRGYPDFCIVPIVSDNRCSNEGDPLGLNGFDFNALNHRDFRGNWGRVLGATQVPRLDAVYTQNSLIGGDNN
jgi:hypothetical protein